MAEFWLSYNPFTVVTELYIKKGDKWIPVSEESGLLRVSKMRMQRWLEPTFGKAYFEEMREAVGDDDIDIFFSGTKEDMDDLKKAAATYSFANTGVTINIKPIGNAEKNSSKAKLKQLNEIIKKAETSDYKLLLPVSIWNYLNDCLNPPSTRAVLLPFMEWEKYENEIFSNETWQMICLTFPFEEMQSKQMRKLFFSFEKKLDFVKDRRFDRERFLFLCYYCINSIDLDNKVKKIFTEYGMQDMNVRILSERDLDRIDDLDADNKSQNLREVQQCVIVFHERYAEQYRLRKIHDVIQQMFYEQGFAKGSKLFRKVDHTLRENESNSSKITDAIVQQAFEWISDFLDSIEHLLDIEMFE